MKNTLHIIPHSHWDREWYMPFEKHRARLVDLLDTLIRVMEENPDYLYYHLDGQFIVIEDYLEIRPSMKDRLLKLIKDGRICVGPWYVLQDEYLISGEANVRNMLYGIRLCKEFGAEPLACGYFPDAFGNISQAPQILRGFGIDNAVFGRGVNDVGYNNSLSENTGIHKSELIWRAPDGSEVIGVMFAGWYNNAAELPYDENELTERIKKIVTNAESYALTSHLLGMNGSDHQPVQLNLSEIIESANKVQDEAFVKHSSIPSYISEIRPFKNEFPVFEGEINGQLSRGTCPLICTASAHMDIKQDNYRVEHLLEHIAEPVSALAMICGGKYDSDLFLYTWKKLMENHPHDSICTCSCDEVYDEMKVRFAKAESCAEILRDRATEYLASVIDTSAADGNLAIALFSLTPHDNLTTVKIALDFPTEENVNEIAIFDSQGKEIPCSYKIIRNQFTYTLPNDGFRKVKYQDRFEVEMLTSLKGLGYAVYSVKKARPTGKTSIKCTDTSMENEHILLRFNKNGTVDITDKGNGKTYKGQNLFEDSRDVGNLYNYVQPEADIPRTCEDSIADISLFHVTPYSVTFKSALKFDTDIHITSFATLYNGIKRVDFKTEVKNGAKNHRLRALFPSGIKTDTVMAEGQFDLVKRSITPAKLWENPCNAQRMQAFVALEDEKEDSGLMISTRGLPEYEILRDGKNTVAITLLRAVAEMGDWGVFPTPKGQMRGEFTFEYSFIPYKKSQNEEAYELGYSYAYPSLLAVPTDIHKGRVSADKLIALGSKCLRISALKKAEDRDSIILRLFNISDRCLSAKLSLSPIFKSAYYATLGEDRLEPIEITGGVIELHVKKKKIVTIELCC